MAAVASETTSGSEGRERACRMLIAVPAAARAAQKPGCKVGAEPKGDSPMHTSMPTFHPTPERELELARLGDEIAELAAHLEAATARLLDLIREFDARSGWGNGFRSCAEWLTWRIGLAPGAAREHVRVARALGSLPRLAAVLARGELSYSKVRALTRVATPETEERLLEVGRAGTAAHVERIVRAWRYVDRQADGRTPSRPGAACVSRRRQYGHRSRTVGA
jgi:hypothetical protein